MNQQPREERAWAVYDEQGYRMSGIYENKDDATGEVWHQSYTVVQVDIIPRVRIVPEETP